MTVTAGRVVICDDHVRAQQANLKHHASQKFFLTPGTKRLFGRLGKTKITEAEKVWFRALDFSRGHRFARANHAEFFVELGTDRVLTAFTKSREERDGVNSVFATQNGERAAIFVVRVCGDTHDCPRVREIEQRLM